MVIGIIANRNHSKMQTIGKYRLLAINLRLNINQLEYLKMSL